MLFSTEVTRYRCEQCPVVNDSVSAFSVLPFLTILVGCTFLWHSIFENIIGISWLTLFISMFLSLIIFILTFTLIDMIGKNDQDKCPLCGKKMEVYATGFYHDLIPHWTEFIVYGVSISLPLLIKTLN